VAGAGLAGVVGVLSVGVAVSDGALGGVASVPFPDDDAGLEIPEFESDEEPLPVGTVREELPFEVSLALCATAGSRGMTIATEKVTKKTAQPITVRHK